MTNIHLLEISGADPQLDIGVIDLARVGAPTTVGAPVFRIYESTNNRFDWRSVRRLRNVAHELFVRNDRTQIFAPGINYLLIEPGARPRAVGSAHAALSAQAELPNHDAIVVETIWPETGTFDDANLHRWIWLCHAALDDDNDAAPAAAPRRIERPPPAAPEVAKAADQMLDRLFDDVDRWCDSTSVGRTLSGNPEHANPKMATTRARRRGKIFGVWDGNGYRYPAFQFDVDRRVRPEMSVLIDALPRDSDGSGRDAALWLFAPDAALDGRTPADVFAEDPARVIALATARRDGSDAMD